MDELGLPFGCELCEPDPERVIEGLRDTGYNFNTAIADIVDNSISAGANNINIIINMDPDTNVTVYIADDGCGMNAEELLNAMRYGSKVRSDPNSLGKFGLGLKTASTAFCRCLSVITKSHESGDVHKARWDLDFVGKTHQFLLQHPPVTADELHMLNQTATGDHGTLVVWENVDRLLKTYINPGNAVNALKKKKEELAFHLSMVYQRFLDINDNRARNVKITLDGTTLLPWDPFATSESQTLKYDPDTISVTFVDEDGKKKEASFTMRAFVLPRQEQFSTTEAQKSARISNDMQGFYVYRENRLISYADWLSVYSKESHRSLLRIEFSFDHELDEAFNVDIKKSRILPAEEIVDYIKDSFIGAPSREADDRYRKGKSKKVSDDAKNVDAHAASNNNIEGKANQVEESKITVVDEAKNEIQIVNSNGTTLTHTIKIVSNSKPGQVRVIPVDDLEGGQLWQPGVTDDGGHHAVLINQSHPYYQKIYYPVIHDNVMITGMDALLWSLAEAENSTVNEATLEQYEDMRYMVSKILKKLVADLPEPDIEDE